MQVLLQDIRHALRQFRRDPGFALTAVLTLALGVGATVAVFSVAYGVLVNPFPYRNVHTLATPRLCSSQAQRCYWDVYTPQQFLEIERNTNIFSGITASTITYVTLAGGPEPERVRGNYITPNTFDVLGVQPMLGRASTASDVQPGHEPVALLSYRYWQAHFGGSASVLGRVMVFNHQPRTVIGVMPPRFLWRGGDVYLPIDLRSPHGPEIPGSFALVGRVKPGVTQSQASAELLPIFHHFSAISTGDFPRDLRVSLMSFDQMFQSDLASPLHLLLGAVFVLLLIACVNVSSLLLGRAVRRDHDVVVRIAVGASPMRLARSTLTEAGVLAAAAIPFSLALAWIGLQAMLRIVPAETIPDEAVVTLNVPVLLVSLGIALLTVLVFGLAPALHSARPRLTAALNAVRSTGTRTERRVLSGFVITEIALSLALLMLAGLMVRSLLAVESMPVPFAPEHTLLVRIPLDKSRYPKLADHNRFFRAAMEKAAAVPGVKAVTVDADYFGAGSHIKIGSQPIEIQRDFVLVHPVDPQYLAISDRRLLQGRFIGEPDIQSELHNVVVTETLAKRFFHGRDALGQTIQLPELFSGDPEMKSDSFIIVGVISDIPPFPGDITRPQVLLPYSVGSLTETLVVSTILPATSLEQPVRMAIASVDADQPIADVTTVRELLDRYGYAGPRFMLALFGTFAAVALLLSLVGIYGVLSFLTSQRTREIGVRMALGANRGNVIWLVTRQACELALLGIAAGLPLVFIAGRLAKQELFETSQFDPVVIAVAVAVLPILAVAGTWLPARRAARIDPVRALRSD
jgi:predicted permease